MPALTTASRTLARSWTAHQLPAARASCSALQTQQTRSVSEVSTTSSFDSPFKGAGSSQGTTKIPSFAKYRNKGGENGLKVFQYFMVGTMGAITAMGAKATVQGAWSFHLQKGQEQLGWECLSGQQ
jgi:ubiquinol-cytochrome c reductase iron-sulfur subunit